MTEAPERRELIAVGRTFAVHRGVWTASRRPVICKSIADGAILGDGAARLENEFAITRRLAHPALVVPETLIDTEDGPLLIFPDHGLTALDRLCVRPCPAGVRRIAMAIGGALAALHAAGIVHRDVKPANIVATPDFRDVRLIDHCLAIRADDLAAEAPGSFAARGTAAFMAPEQTGRMNRQVDHRADLYSLGITLYALLTGRAPFDGGDPAEIVYRHLTEMPPSPQSLEAGVPDDLDRAVMALIGKNPEDRFQSAEDFLAAIQPAAGRAAALTIADRLYGRDALIARVSADIAAHAAGPARLIRVAGPSGIGKTAAIRAMVAEAVAGGALFLSGKFDQIDRARPYGPFLQAAHQLLRRVLAGPAETLADWRDRLNAALAPNGQVLLDLMPDFEALIGPQPAVAELGLNEARIRMSLVFRRFVRALARPEAPLILFFDDLQWSDGASRQLIELMLSDREIAHLTVITAHRDAEVGAGHPVSQLFRALADGPGLAPPIQIGPLGHDDIAGLLADALDRPGGDVAGLARLIQGKTGGNPFFVRQFLGTLARNGLVRSGPDGWTWDLADIQAQRLTDNVADLVGERIADLPEPTQALIRTASCCGNAFDAATLGLVEAQSPENIARTLAPAIQADILRAEEPEPGAPARYGFQHDRIQSTVHESMAVGARGALHARIGTVLLQRLTPAEIEARLIDITDHLIAGQALLGPEGWQKDPAAIFEVVLQRAEVSYLLTDIDGALGISEELLARDLPVLDRIRVLELQILVYMAQLRYRRALKVGQRALALLGHRLPLSPSAPQVMRAFAATKLRLTGKTDARLLALPPVRDAGTLATIRVLGLMAAPAYFTELYLLPLIGLRIVDLTVRHGNAPHSPYGWVILGMLHCALLGAPRRGLAYGDLARRSAEALGAQDIECRVLMVYAGFIQHWTAPLSDTLEVYRQGWEAAIAAGDLEYHGYTRYGHASYALMAGQPLARVADLLDQHLGAVTEHFHEKTHRIMLMARASISRMRGLAPDQDRPFDPEESYRLWTDQADATSLAYFHKYAMLEALMAGDYAAVLREAEGMTRQLNGILSMAFQPFYRFYEALALLELARSGPAARRLRYRLRARWLIAVYRRWARQGPQNFMHRALLLDAERAALAGRDGAAIQGFEAAVAAARRAGALHDVGLFHERAARFYLAHGAEAAAASHLAEAGNAYAAWGGRAWADALATRHPRLTQAAAPHRETAAPLSGDSSSSGSEIVDSQTLIAAAAALAKKTTLSEVIQEVMRAIVVNAGADRGVLLLHDGEGLAAVAEAAGAEVALLDPDAVYDAVPEAVLNYVRHARAPLVLDDAVLDPDISADPYIQAARPSSILSVPLLAKGDLTGIVYLENSHLRAAFTPGRCRTVEVLGAQAAVSVENARLFDELRGALERQVDLTSAHARFVPHRFLQLLNRSSIDRIALGDHVQAEASILFSDIRGFTAMVEEMEPVEAIRFINAYLSRMEPAVQAEGGFVDSYVGDAVMAVFDRGPEAAITASLAMVRALRAWSRAQRGALPIRIGIGVATGEIMFGTIGAANRMKCGVIGSAVNLASRVEGLTKRYGLSLLITQGTYLALSDPSRFDIREIDIVRVVGRTAPVRLFEVFDGDPKALRQQKRRTADDVARAQRLYMAGALDQAQELFEQCARLAPDDPLMPVMLDRCRQHGGRDRAAGWDDGASAARP